MGGGEFPTLHKHATMTFTTTLRGSVQNVDPQSGSPYGPLLDPIWTTSGPHLDPFLDPHMDPFWTPFFNDGYVIRLLVSCMYFRMIPAVIKFLDDQQSRELRRIRTTCSTVYLHGIVNKYRSIQTGRNDKQVVIKDM